MRYGQVPRVPRRVVSVTAAAAEGLFAGGPDQLAPGMHPAFFACVVRNLVPECISRGPLIVYTDLPGLDRAYADLRHPIVGRWSQKYPFVGTVDGETRHLPGQHARAWNRSCPIRAFNEGDLARWVERFPAAAVFVVASNPEAVPTVLPERRHIVLTSPYPATREAVGRLRTPLVHQRAEDARLPRGPPWSEAEVAENNATRPSVAPVAVSSSDDVLASVDATSRRLFSYWSSHPGFVGLAHRVNARLQANAAPFSHDENDLDRPEVGVRGLLASARVLLRAGRHPPTPDAVDFVNHASTAFERSEHLVPPKGAWLRDHAPEAERTAVIFDSGRAARALRSWLPPARHRSGFTARKASPRTVLNEPCVLPGAPTRAAFVHLLHAGCRELTLLLYPWEARRFNEAARAVATSARRLGVSDWPAVPEALEPPMPRTVQDDLVATVPDFDRYQDVREGRGGETVEDDAPPARCVSITTEGGTYRFRPERTVLVLRGDDVEETAAQGVREGDILVRLVGSQDADANSVVGSICRENPRMSGTFDLATSWQVLLEEHVAEKFSDGTISDAHRALEPGVDRAQFGHWLHGDVVAPQHVNLRRVATILGLPARWADNVHAAARAHYQDRRKIRRHLYHLARNQAHLLYQASLQDEGDALETLLRAPAFETIQEVSTHDAR